MTETKKDVFEVLLKEYCEDEARIDGLVNEPDEHIPEIDAEYFRLRYAAAPAEEVKVPRDVNEYIKWGKEYSLPLYMMMSFKFIRSQKFEKLTDAVESWIIDYSEQFARAYLAWPNVEVEK